MGQIEYIWCFLTPGGISAAIGISLYRPWNRKTLPPLMLRESMVIVVLGWTIAFIISAWPFSLADLLPYRLALFESISGWTTTGLSVVNEEATPRVFLFWRSLMQYLGGAGFAIAMLSSILGPTGAAISRAEGRQEVLPMVRQSASTISTIYLSYAAFATIGLRIFGMTWFDALNHAMAALSTGGFSTRADSIGAWNMLSLHLFTIALMLLGNTNFVTHHLLWRRRWKQAIRNPEFKVFAVLSISAIISMVVSPLVDVSVSDSVFQVLSALSTTGFGTADISGWSAGAVMIIILLMIVGGGINSTAGGIKQRRIYLIFQSIWWQVREDMLPRRAVVSHSIDDHGESTVIGNVELRKAANFVLIFIATLFIATIIISLAGYTLRDALFEASSALGTVGLSVGVTSAEAPPAVLWTLKAAMFLGRLEFFAIIVALRKAIQSLKTG